MNQGRLQSRCSSGAYLVLDWVCCRSLEKRNSRWASRVSYSPTYLEVRWDWEQDWVSQAPQQVTQFMVIGWPLEDRLRQKLILGMIGQTLTFPLIGGWTLTTIREYTATYDLQYGTLRYEPKSAEAKLRIKEGLIAIKYQKLSKASPHRWRTHTVSDLTPKQLPQSEPTVEPCKSEWV